MPTKKTSAPSLKPFNNPVTIMILSVCIILIGSGVILAITGSFWGVIIGAVGVLALWAGDTQHKVDPRTAGVLTCWDSFINEDSGGIIIGGRTILANYFPLFISSTSIDISDVDHDFNMTIVSVDNFPLTGAVSVRLRPDVNDLIDYIQSGKMTEIIKLLDDVIYQYAKTEAFNHEGTKLIKDSRLISNVLEEKLRDFFAHSSYGVNAINVQARFNPSQKILKAMEDQASEVYQRRAEEIEAETNLAITKKYEDSLGLSKKEAWEEFKTARLIRDERVSRIETTGKGGSIVLADAKLNMGGKKE